MQLIAHTLNFSCVFTTANLPVLCISECYIEIKTSAAAVDPRDLKVEVAN